MGVENEHFPTPSWATERLIEEVPEISQFCNAHEPCVGDGSVISIFRECEDTAHIVWSGCDIARYEWVQGGKPEVFEQCSFSDFVREGELYITNPHFTGALDVAKHGLAHWSHVVLLVRITWLESEKRNQWIRANPPSRLVYLPRRFRGPNGRGGIGNDSAGRVWLLWGPGFNPGFSVARY